MCHIMCRRFSLFPHSFVPTAPPASYRYIVVHKRHHLTTTLRVLTNLTTPTVVDRRQTDTAACRGGCVGGREGERRTERLCGQRLTSDWLAQDEKDKNPDEIIIVVIIYVKQCNSRVTMSHKKRMDTRDKRTIILGDILINGGSHWFIILGIIRYRLCLLYWWCAALICKSYVLLFDVL